jgi:hypothetical protein
LSLQLMKVFVFSGCFNYDLRGMASEANFIFPMKTCITVICTFKVK